ncbi:putative response regulator receiver (CheY-like protein) [Rubellimicrobium mesophilum DSM 19309]|uniref:Putative response regulator receiver (CheY-like protein) n=1 Tax=Rubellimicrobium mesophilum DSM 19309 TaxID=442562 RepID=A0A017HT56_9RHOB|nr:response regulator [Rubellimicrobium mesophilum]EYD76939.1 putative response regulator receiver (CheY-like protein) [Rubellimicrobium mesophilum DSM 19309]
MATKSPESPCILVVEDEYLLADDLRRDLEAAGARVLGPVASVPEALELIEEAGRVDAAILDVNLAGRMVFPVAEVLSRRGVPFVFATGYERWALPEAFARVPRCDKPLDADEVLRTLDLGGLVPAR